jgi:selenophosphate synthetase-related protein
MFVAKPRSSEAYEGDTVIIMCEVIGDPKPEVVWLRDFLKVRKKRNSLFISDDLEPSPIEDSLRLGR